MTNKNKTNVKKEKDSKNKDKKELNKPMIIGVSVGALVLVIILALLIPTSPFSIWNKNNKDEVQEQIETVKEIYEEQGVTIEEEDIIVEEVNGEPTVEVVEDKRKEMRKNAQSTLDNIISKNTGRDKPNRDENGNKVEGEDPDNYFVNLEEVVQTANDQMNVLKGFIEKSYKYDEENYVDNYTELLINQRQTGNPSSDSPFVISIYTDDRETSYGEFNQRLNGQSFLNVNYEYMTGGVEDIKHFNPYYFSFYSENLYNNILNKNIYNKQFDINSEISVTEYKDGKYTLHTNGGEMNFVTIAKMSLPTETFVLGMDNDKFVILDIL